MKCIELREPSQEMTQEQLFWNNLKTADDLLNFNLFGTVLLNYFKINPGHTFQDLEKELRQRNFNTHLFASEMDENVKKTHSLVDPSDEKPRPIDELRYYCIASCTQKENSIEQLKARNTTYDENFEKLKYTGRLMIREELKDAAEDVKFLDENTIKLSKNNIELRIVEKSDRLFIKELIYELKKKHKDVKARCLSVSDDLPVICFCSSNNDILSKYGYSYDPILEEYKVFVLDFKKNEQDK